ncbi:TPA: hypothetical protein HA241_05005 [Candidatus Woesearchaeota archaeon]|nr:hypothetical protein [Candidatus Woesearchaeota archaeon]
MKLILHEQADERLDTLRKIFNIDKYKIIRENGGLYLRKLRTSIAVLESKTEQLLNIQQKAQEITSALTNAKEQLEKTQRGLALVQKERIAREQKIKTLENQLQQFQQLKNRDIALRISLQEKREQQKHLFQKKEQMERELNILAGIPNNSIDEIRQQLSVLEQEKNTLVNRKSFLQDKIQFLNARIREAEEQIQRLTPMIDAAQAKEILITELNVKLQSRQHRKEKQTQLQQLWEKNAEVIAKNEALLNQENEIYQKVTTLNNCPTCLQEVTTEHKRTITQNIAQKAERINTLLAEAYEQKKHITEQQSKVTQELDELSAVEKELAHASLDILKREEYKKQCLVHANNLALWKQEYQLLSDEWNSSPGEQKIIVLNTKIGEIQQLLQPIIKRNLIQQQQKELLILEENNKNILNTLEQELEAHTKILIQLPDPTPTIIIAKQNYTQIVEKEKQSAVLHAQHQSIVQQYTTQEQEIKLHLSELLEQKQLLTRTREYEQWLENHFLKLTYTIEKHIMIQIHRHFNGLFQEWFGMLMNDDTITARIDDTFTPIIEQNGYDLPFENLSGGEKTSVALAYRLALNKAINDIIHHIQTKDIIILDEPTDGFSSEQLDRVRDVLEKLNLKQTIIVSHETKIESFVNTVIRIQKQETGSCIV